jgi:hypothetical protein
MLFSNSEDDIRNDNAGVTSVPATSIGAVLRA